MKNKVIINPDAINITLLVLLLSSSNSISNLLKNIFLIIVKQQNAAITELKTAIIDKKINPSFIEAERMKNFAKNPAKGGIPAREKKNTNMLMDFEFEANLKPLSWDIFVNSPFAVLRFNKTAKIPNVVIK